MIQLNNLTEVNAEMTELSDRQTGNIKGGKINPKAAEKFFNQALATGKTFTAGELNTYRQLQGLQG
jgi:hypothetical protein